MEDPLQLRPLTSAHSTARKSDNILPLLELAAIHDVSGSGASGKWSTISRSINVCAEKLTFFALIFLGARLFVKFRKFGTLSIDDGFLILAALCLVGDLAIQQYMWNEGQSHLEFEMIDNWWPQRNGKHWNRKSRELRPHLPGNLRDDDLYDPADRFKMIVPGSILYVTSLWAIKVALVRLRFLELQTVAYPPRGYLLQANRISNDVADCL
jgi:hypothetical protein